MIKLYYKGLKPKCSQCPLLEHGYKSSFYFSKCLLTKKEVGGIYGLENADRELNKTCKLKEIQNAERKDD